MPLDKKPSVVFLELWREFASVTSPSPTVWVEYAEAWRQIVSLEELYAAALQLPTLDDLLVRQDDGALPAPDPKAADAAKEAAADAVKAEIRAEAGRQGIITRKRKLLEALDALRADGITLQQIADAGRGLNINVVMDALDRKILPLPVIAALEKAVAKLRSPEERKEADDGTGDQ